MCYTIHSQDDWGIFGKTEKVLRFHKNTGKVKVGQNTLLGNALFY